MTRPLLLTYRALGLGDLLTSVPALRALAAAFPDHEHVLAAPAGLAPLVRAIEAVDRHLAVDELEPLPGLAARPRVAVNLHGRGPQSHRVLLATRPERLIAFPHPAIGPAAARWDPHEYEVRRWCRLLESEGIPTDPRALHLRAPAGPTPPGLRGATIVHPGAKSPSRRWPAERYAAVADHERRHGRRVIVTGSHDELGLAEHVAASAGLGPGAVLAGRVDLGGLARLIAAAGRVVCGDTGVAHLATASGTPSVVLFGPTSPEAWGPPRHLRDRHRVLWSGRLGDPLGRVADPGLLEITVEQVVGELTALDAVEAGAPTLVAMRP